MINFYFMAKYAKIQNGQVAICDTQKSGVFRFINIHDGKPVAADYDTTKDLILITSSSGIAYIYDAKRGGWSTQLRSFPDSITSARWAGNEIIVTTSSGKTKIYNMNGFCIRNQ